MIGPGIGVQVYLAVGVTDMRRGIAGLSGLVENVLRHNPAYGAVFAFRGRKGDRIKLFHWDGQGFCPYYKISENGCVSCDRFNSNNYIILPYFFNVCRRLFQECLRSRKMSFEALEDGLDSGYEMNG